MVWSRNLYQWCPFTNDEDWWRDRFPLCLENVRCSKNIYNESQPFFIMTFTTKKISVTIVLSSSVGSHRFIGIYIFWNATIRRYRRVYYKSEWWINICKNLKSPYISISLVYPSRIEYNYSVIFNYCITFRESTVYFTVLKSVFVSVSKMKILKCHHLSSVFKRIYRWTNKTNVSIRYHICNLDSLHL